MPYPRGVIAVIVLLYGCLSVLAAAEPEDIARIIRRSDPLTPEDERKSFVVPPGFEVQLVAAEPDIAKPMNLAFDARGRLWVSSSEEYPYAAPEGRPARDTIKILEDTDGDGRADVITTFADDLNIPIGLYPYRDGVICYSIPYIWFLRDTDGDGKCDAREKLFGPFDATRDTHGMCNGFTRGFDGWLYACHGFNNQSTVAGADGRKISMQSGNTFRLRLDGSRVEHFTFGQVNPFGMAVSELGDLFTADCHTKPITLLLEGGYYESFGKPHDGLGFVPGVMQHLHGSTAIGGIALYCAADFPTAYRGHTFGGNVMTSRINRNSLHYDGSSVRAAQEADFLISGDSWFRPVDLQLGPDGALYVADFYNRIIGHYEVKLDHPGRDRHRGRIWRIAYVGGEDAKDSGRIRRGSVDLTKLTFGQLFEELASPNLTRRLLAIDRLVDHFAAESIVPARELLSDGESPRSRVQALWILFRLGAITRTDLRVAVGDVANLVRIHAFRVLGELSDRPESMDAWLMQGFRDADPHVRRAAVMAVSKQLSPALLEPLVALFHRTPNTDVHLRYAVRLALRNHLQKAELFRALSTSASPQDTELIAGICLALKTPEAGDFIIRNIHRLSSGHQAPLSAYVTFAARYVSSARVTTLAEYVQEQFAGNLPFQQELLESVHTGLKQRGGETPHSVRVWALTLATKLLGTNTGDTPLAWTYAPHPLGPDRGNPWSISNVRRSADGVQATPLHSSFPQGEQLTGIYRSEAFTLSGPFRFYVAGHDGPPSKPLQGKNFIRLRDAEMHALLKQWNAPRSDVAQLAHWHADETTSRKVYVELVDGDTAGAYAWLAAGRFSEPRLNPSRLVENRRSAARLGAEFRLTELRASMAGVLRNPQTDRETCSVIASSLVSMNPNSPLAALAEVTTITGVPEEVRRRALDAVISQDSTSAVSIVSDAMQTATAAEQLRVAEKLSASADGIELLLNAVESGRAATRLLTRVSVRQKLDVIASQRQQDRIESLSARLPDENEQLTKLITQIKERFLQEGGSRQAGEGVYRKNCAVCHQVAGTGKQVGPNLDGIGNRGLDRLVEDILAPNLNVDVAFRSTIVVTEAGQVLSGLVKRTEGAQLFLVDAQGNEILVPTDEVEETKESVLSPMPVNFGEVLESQDFQHLMSYLLSLRN